MSCLNIFVAGHRGMVGSAIIRRLKNNNNNNIITQNKNKLDLTNQNSVKSFFRKTKIDQVYIAAAKVGGIYANKTYPAEFIYENLMIETNVIQAAFENKVKKLLFLGSSCIYPKLAKQPMQEEELLTGVLEATNEPYAIAKIAGIKMCESFNHQYGDTHKIDYRSVMPTNLYGYGDHYHKENSHVIPALIRKFHEAKIKNLPKVILWGTGKPKREFLFVDDLARACVYIMNLNKNKYLKNIKPTISHINVGSGLDLTIKDLAKKIKEITQFKGAIEFDVNQPDGMKRKLLDSKRINEMGWKPEISLDQGLRITYEDYLKRIR
jgi:GDP-L-fucose synthase